jgi:hypothetical protein
VIPAPTIAILDVDKPRSVTAALAESECGQWASRRSR